MARSESMEGRFTRFIEDFEDDKGELTYEHAISEMVVKGIKSFVVNFTELYGFDEELARTVMYDPETYSAIFGSVVRSKLRTRDPLFAESLDRANIRYRNLPAETHLRKIGSQDISHLVMVNGIIVRASAVTPLVTRATFRCSICGDLNHLEQSGQTMMKPQKCGSCDNRKGFELVPKESVFIDSQSLSLQECPEDLPTGQIPRAIKVELKDDLVDRARPGDRITLTGFIKLLPRYGRGGELRTFNLNLEASYVDVEEDELLELTPEDIEEIKVLGSDPLIHQNLLTSIAPSIYGNEYIKQAVLYMLLGGVAKERADVRIRGDINVLLLGDPGTAKSQMLNYASKVSPRAILTTGRGSTAAGLTAAIYASRGKLKTLVIAGEEPGGQLTLTTDVEDFPGFPEVIQGPELMTRMKKQAQRLGADFVDGNVTSVDFSSIV